MPNEARYLKLVVDPIRVCGRYKPKFGQGAKEGGLSLVQFQTLYQEDAFYHWMGLDNPMMYAAHKAAGGMTSIYRQIGIGCEKLFRTIIQDSLGLSSTDSIWSYEVQLQSGKKRKLSLDARVELEKILDPEKRERFQAWMEFSAETLGVDPNIFSSLTGTVFEIRQGYKSKDSKRQNADIANASTAYTKAYLPCAVILSTQIDNDILYRYKSEKWVVLTGIHGSENALASTYDFMRDVIGYDLAAFFERNSQTLRREIDDVLNTLLTPGRS